jgi:hypothetical protein
MSNAKYYSVGIPMNVLDIIKKIVIETKLYRNPSDFVLFAVREKIDEIHKNQIDQKKIEAFFIRENQIRAEYSKEKEKEK